MKRTYQKLSALLLALALCLSLSVPALAAEESGLKTTAETAAAGAMTYGGASQISWAVWQDGKIVESGLDGGPREDPSQSPLQALAASVPGTVYGIGSVSKIYTTVAAMQLAEAGKLSLDKPVTAYLPEFKMADERYKQITVRMLLNHSSGLMGSSMGSGLLFDDPSEAATDQLLERLAVQRLKADPGAYSVYCNDGFTLAQLVVEAVSGQEFMDYLRANILKPAGLKETYAPGDSFNSRAAIYNGTDSTSLPMDCLGVLGTGGLYATAEDLAAFGGALTGETLLKKSSLDAMAAPEYARGLWPEEDVPDALAYGLGWDSVEWFPFHENGIQALVKGGDTQYYHAGLVVLPEHNMAAAVLSSGGVSTYNEMAASQMLIAALAAKGVEVDETPAVLPEASPAKMPRELMNNAGYYGSIQQYKVDVAADGTLTMSYLGMEIPAQTFTYHDDGTFRDESGTACLKFVQESNGGTYLYQRAFTQLPGLGGLGTSNYAAVKLPENKISPELQKSWNDFVSGTSILPMNERYSSQIYLALTAAAQVESSAAEGVPGYMGALKIVDETHAQYAVQIPGNVGRDGYDLELRRDEAGALWLHQSNGAVYMEETAVPVLSTGNGSVRCTIQPDGYARWYKVGDSAAGKTMAVQLPENAGFWVYDKDWNVTASSVVGGDKSAKLPEGGTVVLAGDPGARFQLSFS
ncbi:serine hydrolase domain-containing protein [Oscillibacter sp. 1-3]|uniref:serine hydrolase n=1 Tax=Oscillibacter sp. 1-3 TaxID=1235797 RepID=UPI000335BF6A|nr:serine hydrolase domain-containing protein [Oscillibacter sp. 1-3]EOS65992.1 hypothetical protein C816_01846 [Oscillibacter sp. 1-3]